jgi:hypothetical protein
VQRGCAADRPSGRVSQVRASAACVCGPRCVGQVRRWLVWGPRAVGYGGRRMARRQSRSGLGIERFQAAASPRPNTRRQPSIHAAHLRQLPTAPSQPAAPNASCSAATVPRPSPGRRGHSPRAQSSPRSQSSAGGAAQQPQLALPAPHPITHHTAAPRATTASISSCGSAAAGAGAQVRRQGKETAQNARGALARDVCSSYTRTRRLQPLNLSPG